MATRANFSVRYRQAAEAFLEAFEQLNQLSTEHDILQITVVDGDLPPGDLTGAEFETGLASAKTIWNTFTGSAHAKNIYKLRQ